MTDYGTLRDDLAAVLCTDGVIGQRPCEQCLDAANRIVVHRRSIRRVLIRFAREEADLNA